MESKQQIKSIKSRTQEFWYKHLSKKLKKLKLKKSKVEVKQNAVDIKKSGINISTRS
jgi:hypothetical protein